MDGACSLDDFPGIPADQPLFILIADLSEPLFRVMTMECFLLQG